MERLGKELDEFQRSVIVFALLGRKLAFTDDGDDVLERVIFLEDRLDLCRQYIMPITNDLR